MEALSPDLICCEYDASRRGRVSGVFTNCVSSWETAPGDEREREDGILHDGGDTIARAPEAGVADYIVEPYSPVESVARVGLTPRRCTAHGPLRIGDDARNPGYILGLPTEPGRISPRLASSS